MTGADIPDHAELTTREREVLAMVVEGKTNREIGAALYISESTAGVHVSNILAKLGVSSRTEAATFAIQAGLIGTPPAAVEEAAPEPVEPPFLPPPTVPTGWRAPPGGPDAPAPAIDGHRRGRCGRPGGDHHRTRLCGPIRGSALGILGPRLEPLGCR